ncbi:Hypothetical protein, putative [Bodo saltans]|uniref:Uncharacterized protein n=1 Tax=Bodo saltans TaxID=75058 RepID=A0A0S4J537_BODSA|nr:Hypothetical protein, putative [Bodo saltans]|eukprot:CUG86586.1 Hypothetical protein, putative [Bodo saltans]
MQAHRKKKTVHPFVYHGIVVPPPAESIPHTRANISPNRSGKHSEGGVTTTTDDSIPRAHEQTQSPPRRNSDIPPGPHTRPLSPPPRDRQRGHGDEVHDDAHHGGGARSRESPRHGSPQRESPRRAVTAVESYTAQDSNFVPTHAAAGIGRGPSGAGRPPVSTSATGSRSASYSDAFGTSGRGVAPPRSASSAAAFSPHLPPGVNTPPAVATPPSEPVDIRENSPANAMLQSSQHRPPTTFIEASPMKQDHPRRKLPPVSA